MTIINMFLTCCYQRNNKLITVGAMFIAQNYKQYFFLRYTLYVALSPFIRRKSISVTTRFLNLRHFLNADVKLIQQNLFYSNSLLVQ